MIFMEPKFRMRKTFSKCKIKTRKRRKNIYIFLFYWVQKTGRTPIRSQTTNKIENFTKISAM